MGLFDARCGVSGVPLSGPTALIVLTEEADGWRPAAMPLVGTYDRSGALDLPGSPHYFGGPVPDGWEALEAWLGELGVDQLYELVDDTITWEGRRVAYALVDAGVYAALPQGALDGAALAGRLGAVKAAVGDLVPVDPDEAESFSGLAGTYGCQHHVDEARTRFAGDPAILAAVEALAARWAELNDA